METQDEVAHRVEWKISAKKMMQKRGELGNHNRRNDSSAY